MAIKPMLATSSDAPNRQAVLTTSEVDCMPGLFYALYEQGYCGCEDCHCLIGAGLSAEEAIADYWAQWSEKHGEVV